MLPISASIARAPVPLFIDRFPILERRALLLLLSGFLFLGMGMDMVHDDLDGLGNDLCNANESTLREIIRESELFLESQLKAGIAADQRAITFSSVMGAIAAILIGGLLTAVGADAKAASSIAWVVIPVAVGLGVSLTFSVVSSRPTDWCYPGNNPRMWRPDVSAGMPFTESLAHQAEQYARGIRANKCVLEKNARMMTWALRVAGITLVVGIGAAISVAPT